MPAKRCCADRGFTVIELLVTLMIMGVMTAIAAAGLSAWSARSGHNGARDEVVSVLRNHAERALSEGRTYCVQFTSNGYQTYRFACAGSLAKPYGPPQTLSDVHETLTPSFTAPPGMASACPASGACAYFYPRGNASTGSVTVRRSGQDDHVIQVKGLTSRVFAE